MTPIRAACLALLATATVGSILVVASAADDLPDSVPVRLLGGVDEPPPRLYALPRKAKPTAEPESAKTKIGATSLVLFDIDGNGSFLDSGVDAWRVDDDDLPYAFPVEPLLVIDGLPTRIGPGDEPDVLRYGRPDSAWPDVAPGRGKGARAELRQAKREVLDALEIWNHLRMRNGLMPVHLDAALTGACLEHARYMARWGVTHQQDPDHDGYSPEGDRVARSGSVGSLAASEEIVEVYSTFYHRISLFHPETRGAGIGTAGSRSVFNGTEGREKRPWTWPVVIPAPDTEDVPRIYHRELPIPHEPLFDDGTIGEAGFPITLTFPRDAVTDVSAELRVSAFDGRAVPFALSWPERPASPNASTNYKSICLLPHAPLKARTTYWVHIEWTYRGELDQATWTFTTGR